MNNNIKKIKRDNVTFILENGLLHNTLGPAVFSDDLNYKEWYINGVLHRENGPAAIFFLPQNEVLNKWYFEGKQYTEEDFLSIYNRKVLKESLNNLSYKKNIKI